MGAYLNSNQIKSGTMYFQGKKIVNGYLQGNKVFNEYFNDGDLVISLKNCLNNSMYASNGKPIDDFGSKSYQLMKTIADESNCNLTGNITITNVIPRLKNGICMNISQVLVGGIKVGTPNNQEAILANVQSELIPIKDLQDEKIISPNFPNTIRLPKAGGVKSIDAINNSAFEQHGSTYPAKFSLEKETVNTTYYWTLGLPIELTSPENRDAGNLYDAYKRNINGVKCNQVQYWLITDSVTAY